MYILGLTGGIASGKSTVSRHLARLGAKLWDADQIAKQIVEPGQLGNRLLREAFGAEYFHGERLDRKKLGELVFEKPEKLARLNAVLHPIVLMQLEKDLEEYQRQECPLVVLDVPLLFESGIDQYCDEVWVVSCGADLQIHRIMERDGLTYADAAARIDAQMSDQLRRERATRVIDSCGTPEETRRFIDILFEELLIDHEIQI